MKNWCYLILYLLPSLSFGQSFTGIVQDINDDVIPFATVFNQRTEEHAHTNLSGEFELNNIQLGDSLFVNCLGYKNRAFVVDNISLEMLLLMEEDAFQLDEFEVSSGLDALNIFTEINLQTESVSSSQEVLRKVPGLIIGQHAGGGKAEQIFLRGFDIDHGTDVSITVDGMPVNMVSHAHGQGYSDLHFLIPETIEKIDFGKGPYSAAHGNFATAGHVGFQTKDKLDNSSLKFEYGSFNSFRTLGMFNIMNEKNKSAYIVSDIQLSDGPFESSQNFRRINVAAKYTTRFKNDDKFSFTLSQFSSRWDASGQIPKRLVDNGTIGRFGAVDDTEGGVTGRTNAKVDYIKSIDKTSFVKNTVFLSQYDFELYSNFTFFLIDSINGDQIRQKENRQIVGGSSEWNKFFVHEHSLKIGVGFRNDQVKDVELSRTKNRKEILEHLQLGDVDETNLYGYVSPEFKFGKWVVNPAVRVDMFYFLYNDATDSLYQSKSAEKSLLSPKLNFIFNQSTDLQFYLKTGTGFHSNDTRVIVSQTGKDILPVAYGGDLGTIWKPTSKLFLNAAFWTLFSEQEFIYVGDAGIVEPSGRSLRLGVDFGVRYQIYKSIFFNADVNYARPRSYDEPKGSDRIPLAPEFTATGGLSLVNFKKINAGIQCRYIANRPANEDNSIVAKGYFIMDLNINYEWKFLTFGIAVKNLFNSEWIETQFVTESRLSSESNPVEEIHFTPGAPISIMGSITYKF